jgi:hypothetical protein
MASPSVEFLTKFRSRKFRETGYETIFVFHENEGRVSQFRKTAEITKETSFAKHENLFFYNVTKHENRENEENLK